MTYWAWISATNTLITTMDNKQGYASKNWAEGISDEAYYPWESQKKFDLNRSALHLPSNKHCFDLLIKANLPVFPNRRKQAKINIVSHFSPSLGLKEPP